MPRSTGEGGCVNVPGATGMATTREASGDEFLDSVVSRRDRGGSFSYGSELSLESFDTRRSLFCMARFHKSACMPLLDASLKDLNKLRILFCKVRFFRLGLSGLRQPMLQRAEP